MAKFARIDGGSVVETLEAEELPEFHPSLQWAACGDEVDVGWRYADNGFSPPVINLADAIEAKLREIDTARDAAIAGGFLFNGTKFDSDAEAIRRINGAITLSLLNPAFETDWITFDNSVVRLDADLLAGLGTAAGAHEGAQIFKARGLKDQVLAASSLDQIAAITW